MLPAIIRVDVHAYGRKQLELIRALPESDKILRIIENGLDISREQFLVYSLFRYRDVNDLESLRNLATAKEALLEAILSTDDTSFWAHPLLDATEHRAEAQDIGEALGLCLMDKIYVTTEQDWSRIPEGSGKSLDYVASDSQRILEVESKGSFVEDRSRKSSAISSHKGDILKKKESRRDSQACPPGVRLGTISAIDRRPGGRPTVWIVDPPVGYHERAPEHIRVLHRLEYILRWLTLINPRSPLTIGLANRLLDLQHIPNPSVLDGISLTGALNKPILPEKDPYAIHGRFFSTRSVVFDGPAGGVIVPSGDNKIFFAGVREDLVDIAISQDFSTINRFKVEPTTLEKRVTGIVSQGRFKKYGFSEQSEAVEKRGTGYFALRLHGELYYSAGGVVFGWLPRPDDL
jgi:hypothetical protein